MDINMKNVKLMRNEKDASDKWIYISEDGVNPTTKLLLDDGKYSNSTQLGMLRDRLAKYNDFNDIDASDKFASSIDWFTTNVLSAVGAQNSIFI